MGCFTLKYDLAPDDFIAYETYVPSVGFLDSDTARAALSNAGFNLPVLLGETVTSYEQLEILTLEQDTWSSQDQREGVLVKISDGTKNLLRFKMRRSSFKPREDFNDTPLRRRGG